MKEKTNFILKNNNDNLSSLREKSSPLRIVTRKYDANLYHRDALRNQKSLSSTSEDTLGSLSTIESAHPASGLPPGVHKDETR